MDYVFTFHDFAGETLEMETRRCSSDVTAVVRAAQMMRDHPQWDSVEVRNTINERLVRRLARADLA